MTAERTQTSVAGTTESQGLDHAQTAGLNDMDPASFRVAAHAAVDVMADYLEGVRDRDVMPNVEPGTLRPLFAQTPPESPAPMDEILADYKRLFEPNAGICARHDMEVQQLRFLPVGLHHRAGIGPQLRSVPA